jgi:hypothetical protein
MVTRQPELHVQPTEQGSVQKQPSYKRTTARKITTTGIQLSSRSLVKHVSEEQPTSNKLDYTPTNTNRSSPGSKKKASVRSHRPINMKEPPESPTQQPQQQGKSPRTKRKKKLSFDASSSPRSISGGSNSNDNQHNRRLSSSSSSPMTSPLNASRGASPRAASPRITTASIRQEMKNAITTFPNLQNNNLSSSSSSHHSPRNSGHTINNNSSSAHSNSSKSPRTSRSPRTKISRKVAAAARGGGGGGRESSPPPLVAPASEVDPNYSYNNNRPKRRSSLSAVPTRSNDTSNSRKYDMGHNHQPTGSYFMNKSMSLIDVYSDEMPTLETATAPVGEHHDDDDNHDHDRMPRLLVRHEQVHLSGVRSGKQWQILDDTPLGHAPEKLTIVPGVDETGQTKRRPYDVLLDETSLDEADDILDDDDDHHGIILYHHDSDSDTDEEEEEEEVEKDERVSDRLQMSLPDDPRDSSLLDMSPTIQQRPLDRFNPTFQSNIAWRPENIDSHDDLHTIADVSLVSDDHSASHSFDLSLLEQSDLAADETRTVDEQNCQINNRRSIQGRGHPESNLNPPSADIGEHESDDEHDEIVENDDDNFGFHVGSGAATKMAAESNDDRWESQKPKSNQKIAEAQRESSDRKKPAYQPITNGKAKQRRGSDSNNENTTPTNKRRSSNQRNKRSPRNRIPSVVHSGRTNYGQATSHSPVSSSFTSTPSSSRQPGKKSLSEYVERIAPVSTDDHTLGASTITTNFSTTQRTQGTVSTRSLFHSSNKCGMDALKIPERRRGDSEDERSEEEEEVEECDFHRRSSTQLSSDRVNGVNANFDMMQSPENPRIDPSVKNRLRRPSGEGDDVLFAADAEDEVGAPEKDAAVPPPMINNKIDEENTHDAPPLPRSLPVSTKGRIPGIFKRMTSWKSKTRLLDGTEEQLIR